MNNSVNSSSEDEIITRTRKVVHEQSFSGSLVEDDYSDSDSLFYEIFGLGNEYDYIYKNNTAEKIDASNESSISIDENECYDYVKKYIENVDIDVIKHLLNGECIEYIAFHLDKGYVIDIIEIRNYVNDYKSFKKLVKNINCDGKYLIDNFRALKLFCEPEKDIFVDGLLSISQYIENIINGFSTYKPVGELNSHFYNSSQYSAIIKQLATNTVFIERVHRLYEKGIKEFAMKYDTNRPLAAIKKMVIQDIEDMYLRKLEQFYLSDTDVRNNSIRRNIIKNAFHHVNDNCFYDIYANLQVSGHVEGINGLADLCNMLISIKKSDVSIGIYMDKTILYVVEISNYGQITTQRAIKISELDTYKKYLAAASNIVVCSNTPNIKKLVDTFDLPCIYLPQSFSIFNDEKEFSHAYNIVAVVQNPVIYFSRVIYEKKHFTLNDKAVDHSVLQQAITIVAATDKLDWRVLFSHPHGFTFVKLIGVKLNTMQISIENVQSFNQLNTYISNPSSINKIFTYFKIIKGKNKLDGWNLHPQDYSATYALSQFIANKNNYNGTEDQKLDYLLTNIHKIDNSELNQVENYNVTKLKRIIDILKSQRYIFQGASDKVVFNDIFSMNIVDVPSNKNGILGTSTGIISNRTKNYLLVDVHGVKVWCRDATDKYEVNQIVDIEILKPVWFKLLYYGKILSKQQPEAYFKHHQLYRSYIPNNMQIFIRESMSNKNACVVVLKIEEDLYFQYKLIEQIYDNIVSYKLIVSDTITYSYDTIDLFITQYLEPLNHFVHHLTTFKYFKTSKEEAESYIREEGEFMKYACFFSKDMPGYITVLFGKFILKLKIDSNQLIFKGNRRFQSLEEFSTYCKRMYNTF